jgi:Xaa-Pro dipeptidase
MQRRHRWIDEMCDRFTLDAVLVAGSTGPLETSVQYFTNWPAQVQSYALLGGGEATTLWVRLWNHLPDAERIAVSEEILYGGDTPQALAEAVAERLALRGARRVGVVGVIPHRDAELLIGRNPQIELVDLLAEYQALRLVKSEEEMVYTSIASRMNDAAVAALAEALTPGLAESEMARVIESVYLGHGGTNLIHFTMSTPMGEPTTWVPHQQVPNRRIAAGDVVVTEISTTFWGYAGQILRTFTVAADPTPRFERLHEVADTVYHQISARLRPGVTVGELLDAADAVEEAGYDIWDDLVHGFGGAYLPPIIRTRASRGATHPDEHPYPEGSLVVVQPNVIDGTAGVQVGNSIHIGQEGPVPTQHYPLILIRCG